MRHDLAQPETWGEAQYRAGHIPGARFAHLDRDLSAPKTGTNGRHPLPSPEACAALFGRLGIDASKQVVAYDSGRRRCTRRDCGGCCAGSATTPSPCSTAAIGKWVREGRPVTADVPAGTPGRRSRSVASVRRSSAGDVLASLGQLASLVDARGAERFRGEVEPLDPVAGHIPGAVNRPYTQNLEPDGTFKQPRDAARRIRAP